MKQSQFDSIMYALVLGGMGWFFYSEYQKLKKSKISNVSPIVFGVRG